MKIIALICASFFCLQLQAQSDKTIDSLKRMIDGHPAQDSVRVKSIYQYLRATLFNSADHEPYIREMLSISRRINFPYGIRKGLRMYTMYYGDRADFQRSFSYADSLTSFLRNDSSYAAKREMAILHWDLANNYNRMGDYARSIEYYFLAIATFEKFNDKNYLGSLYSNLSSIYTNLSDTVRSLEYMNKSLAIAEESSNDDLKCRILMNHANELLNKGKLSRARDVLDKAAPLIVKLQNTAYSQYFFYMKGDLALLQKKFPDAIAHLRRSLQLGKKIDDLHQTAAVMSLMVDCFMAMNNLAESKAYLDSTLLLAEKTGQKKRKKEVYDGFALWYEKKGDYKNSNEYLRRSVALHDSILSEENNKQIASLEMRYQVAGKEAEIKNLRTEKELQQLTIRQKSITNYILIGIAVAILIISLLFYRNYRQKQKLQHQRIAELETERQLNATEAVLKGEEQERTRLAKDLHDGLGGMLSGIKYSFNTMKGNLIMTPENHQAFERSMDMLDSSIKEMRRVAHNMMPEALVRFGLDTAMKDYCHDINQSGALKINYQSIGIADEPIDQTTAITIYRIVQELISNTMKHAAAATAIVQLTKTNGQLSATIEDDGKGFDTSILKQSKGIGWTNIQHRVDFLKGKLDVNSGPGKGTSVHIEFNV
ncbi:tetratricopeptide repeat protein [Fulvivirgaceae bacterium PWU4]|uniref:histidine kinase n=1 Tax=Chryseosolibacter histidini TaxID=2782349 RepID=A0AAP2DKB5_9BACT|nr:tetratricopeptide repeat protein [Chryseosolibacter histidini]MBT1697099.1 tetratricopeptide repeat protein [Chryseosolibacter histidini]